jgi:hypothetical protein
MTMNDTKVLAGSDSGIIDEADNASQPNWQGCDRSMRPARASRRCGH